MNMLEIFIIHFDSKQPISPILIIFQLFMVK